MEELIKKVQEWANERGLNKPEQAINQLLKISEELGEMNGALLRLNKPAEKFIQMPKFIDGIGDLQVTYIVLCNMNNLDYAKIKPTNYSYDTDFMTRERWAANLFHCAGCTVELMSYTSKFKNNVANIKGGIIELCKFFDLTPEQCLQAAYKEIKDRKGVTVNGTFIKDEPKETAQVVDLWDLQVGDSIKFRNGVIKEVLVLKKNIKSIYPIAIEVSYEPHDSQHLKSEMDYCLNGSFWQDHRIYDYDIVQIIKA